MWQPKWEKIRRLRIILDLGKVKHESSALDSTYGSEYYMMNQQKDRKGSGCSGKEVNFKTWRNYKETGVSSLELSQRFQTRADISSCLNNNNIDRLPDDALVWALGLLAQTRNLGGHAAEKKWKPRKMICVPKVY